MFQGLWGNALSILNEEGKQHIITNRPALSPTSRPATWFSTVNSKVNETIGMKKTNPGAVFEIVKSKFSERKTKLNRYS